MNPQELTFNVSLDNQGFLLLEFDADMITIPSSIREYARANGFTSDSKYHITVVGYHFAKMIKRLHKEDEVRQLLGNNTQTWTFMTSSDYLELHKPASEYNSAKQSIITLVHSPEFDAFFDGLFTILSNSDLSMPPPHVTLYTRGEQEGIGLFSATDLDRYLYKKLQ